jgi:hypothetical protein
VFGVGGPAAVEADHVHDEPPHLLNLNDSFWGPEPRQISRCRRTTGIRATSPP